MRRSPTIVVLVECSHRHRAVRAERNTAIDKLVSCEEAASCRSEPEPGGEGRVFPTGCAVYPLLAKLASDG